MGMTVAVAGWPRPRRSRRLPPAVVASLAVHGLLLSLTFGGAGFGLPGLEFPWQTRRAEVPELRVVLQPDAEPAPADTAPPAQAEKVDAATEPDAPAPSDELPPPPDGPAVLVTERPDAVWALPAASAASSVPPAAVASLSSASAPVVERLRRPLDTERLKADSAAVLAQLDASREQVKAAPAMLQAASSPVVEALRRPAIAARPPNEREARERSTVLAQLDIRAAPAQLTAASSPTVEALRRPTDALRARPADAPERSSELARLDSARQSLQGADKIEAARNEALRQEAARAEAARQEAARAEAARAEAARQETARAEAARAEAARQEAARAEAARQAAARQEAARIEAARTEGLRIEAAKLAEAQARAKAEEEAREARLRAIGRQLDEEAAKRDAERQRPDWTPARRARLFGRVDSNAALMAYGEAWARKIENNTPPEAVRDVARQPHTQAMVTVAVRSNGSVESITFVRSSGVPAVDEAIRKIVQGQENYPPFPPGLLRDYDVIEIRRTWQFDSAVRLY